jgi:hypothetical protein
MRCPNCGQDGSPVGFGQTRTLECKACGAVFLQSQGPAVAPAGSGEPTARERADAAKLARIHERAEQERRAKAAGATPAAPEAARPPLRAACWLPWALVSIVTLTGAAVTVLPGLVDGTAGEGSLVAFAEAGDPAAQLSLAMVRDFGLDGAARDPDEARHWYEKAAQAGSVSAQSFLGQWYLARSPQRDCPEAFQWLRIAAERGEPTAQQLLGDRYRAGRGVEKNLEQAATWYRRAADQGNAEALCQLARFNAGAEVGHSQDPPAAAMYDHIAKVLGKDCGLSDYGATAKLAEWTRKEGARRAGERLAAGFGRDTGL